MIAWNGIAEEMQREKQMGLFPGRNLRQTHNTMPYLTPWTQFLQNVSKNKTSPFTLALLGALS